MISWILKKIKSMILGWVYRWRLSFEIEIVHWVLKKGSSCEAACRIQDILARDTGNENTSFIEQSSNHSILWEAD